MKKLTLSKLYVITMMLLFAGVVNSCRDEELTLQNKISEDPVGAQLKQWYYDNERVIHSKNNWLNSFVPDWSRIETSTVDGKTVYEIGLNSSGHVFSASETVDPKKAGNYRSRSLMKLIILEDRKNGQLMGRFMEVVALKKTEELNQLRYKKYGDFSGAINFYQITGSLSKGWLYENGRLVGGTDLRAVNDKKIASSSGNGGTLNLVDVAQCGSVRVPHWKEVCIGVGAVDGWGYGGDGGVTTCHWEVYHTTEVIYCPTNGDDGGGVDNGGGNGSSGSGPDSGQESDAPQEMEFLSDVAISLKDLFKCFDEVPSNGANYVISLNTDLPIDTNANRLLSYAGRPGHSFITLTKMNGNMSVSKSFGFYPNTQIASLAGNPVESKMNDNGGHDYDAMISQGGLTADQFKTAMNKAISSAENDYDLGDYNCTDYALEVFNSIRDADHKIIVPDWISAGLNYGTTPNGLYKRLDIMNSYGNHSVNMVKGKAVPKTPPCSVE